MTSPSPTILAYSQTLGAVDYAALFVYLGISIFIGTYSSRGKKSFDDYCVADRKIPWWAACVSIVATDLSGVSYIGVPAWLFTHDLKYNFGSVLMPLVMLAVVLIFVPVFLRAGVYTVYQYLNRRFHRRAQTITAVLFLMKGFVHLGGAVYAPALALTAATGVPVWICILIIGLCTTAYTMKGGMRAVIWTDLTQFIVLFGGLILILCFAISGLRWDWLGTWRTASHLTAPATHTPYTTLFDWHFNLKTEATVWSLLAFYFVFNMGTYGADQIAVQRYFTVRNFREVVKSVIGSGFVTLITVALMAAVGLALVVYYHAHPALAATLTKTDDVLPHFVMNVLPTGARGVIFAAIFAATMSCVSAGLNSFSTVGAIDLYRDLVKADAPDRHYLLVAKIFTAASGVVVTLIGLLVSTAHTSIIQTINSLLSIFIGPITAMFLLGVLTKRSNIVGVVCGVIAGLICGALLQWSPLANVVNWLWLAPLTCAATFAVGYVASLPFVGRIGIARKQPEESMVIAALPAVPGTPDLKSP
jgi:sodium-coupled monocarboxylate transporter 8/12